MRVHKYPAKIVSEIEMKGRKRGRMSEMKTRREKIFRGENKLKEMAIYLLNLCQMAIFPVLFLSLALPFYSV